jgi:Transglutaminase-like superfamily
MRPWTELPGRFLRLTGEHQRLLVEAGCYLVWARALLWLLSFHSLTRFFSRCPARRPPITGAKRLRFREDIRWAVEAVAERLPGKTACFPRGIAAQAMCRRRGVNATLYYGAANLPSTGFSAHVWVLDETEGVIGHQIAKDFLILARFPG